MRVPYQMVAVNTSVSLILSVTIASVRMDTRLDLITSHAMVSLCLTW